MEAVEKAETATALASLLAGVRDRERMSLSEDSKRATALLLLFLPARARRAEFRVVNA